MTEFITIKVKAVANGECYWESDATVCEGAVVAVNADKVTAAVIAERDELRQFIAQCAEKAGEMVNGNRLSMAAQKLIQKFQGALPSDLNGGATGATPGLLQDDSRPLGAWLAQQPDARAVVRSAGDELPPIVWSQECPTRTGLFWFKSADTDYEIRQHTVYWRDGGSGPSDLMVESDAGTFAVHDFHENLTEPCWAPVK